jgi:hypothetical protein
MSDWAMRSHFKPGQLTELMVESPFGTSMRKVDGAVALRQFTLVNMVLLLLGSLLVLTIGLLVFLGQV